MEEHRMENKNIIGSVILAAGIVAGASILATGFKNIIRTQRTVSVRGLSEREVEADIAVWPLTFQLGSNDLKSLQSDIVAKKETARRYLLKCGLSESDILERAPAITDTTLNPYMDSDRQRYNFIASVTLLVRSPNISAVKRANESCLELAGDGIAVSQTYDSRVTYDFTGLNGIKPEMIAEATGNARAAAEQFARDSGSVVGKIKTAAQGVFTIENAAQGLEERKSIRVVTTVTYLLE